MIGGIIETVIQVVGVIILAPMVHAGFCDWCPGRHSNHDWKVDNFNSHCHTRPPRTNMTTENMAKVNDTAR